MANLALFVFGLPFLGVGVWMLIQSVQTILSSRPDFFELLVHWMIGLPFSLVGGLVVLFSVFGKTTQPGVESPLAQSKRRLGLLSPEAQWSQGRLTSQGLGAVIGGWVAAVFALLIAAPFIAVALTHASRPYPAWHITTLLPLALVLRALYRTLRRHKYGDSICELSQKPNASDGTLQLLIRPQATELPTGNATVDLRCEKRAQQSVGNHRQLQVTVLWHERQSVPVQPNGRGIAATFTIPAECPAAGRQPFNEGIFWILSAQCAEPGIDYFTTFDLAFNRDSAPTI